MENIIFYGVPGCGKSYYIDNEYIKKIIKFLYDTFKSIKRNQVERVVFHQDYTYSDFIGQILPVTMTVPNNNNKKLISYEFKPGPFTKILEKAIHDEDNPYFLIIEEINRGNAPAIFGDIFQLLDRDDTNKSQYEITNENIAEYIYGNQARKIYIPNNLFLVGTMNTSDQNVFTLDTAFQRRWNMELIPNDINKCSFKNYYILDTTVTWEEFWTMANKTISKLSLDSFGSEDKRLGAFFIKEDFFKNAKYFAGKVIKYLWDDAFKMNRSDIFNTDDYPTLEEIINIGFLGTTGNARYRIFRLNNFDKKTREPIESILNKDQSIEYSDGIVKVKPQTNNAETTVSSKNIGTNTPNSDEGTDTTLSNGDNIKSSDDTKTPENTGTDTGATAEPENDINASSENQEPAQEKAQNNPEK